MLDSFILRCTRPDVSSDLTIRLHLQPVCFGVFTLLLLHPAMGPRTRRKATLFLMTLEDWLEHLGPSPRANRALCTHLRQAPDCLEVFVEEESQVINGASAEAAALDALCHASVEPRVEGD